MTASSTVTLRIGRLRDDQSGLASAVLAVRARGNLTATLSHQLLANAGGTQNFSFDVAAAAEPNMLYVATVSVTLTWVIVYASAGGGGVVVAEGEF